MSEQRKTLWCCPDVGLVNTDLLTSPTILELKWVVKKEKAAHRMKKDTATNKLIKLVIKKKQFKGLETQPLDTTTSNWNTEKNRSETTGNTSVLTDHQMHK